MVVYPFFLLYGLTLGLREKAKDVVYIPEMKQEKKKKKKKKKKRKEKKKRKKSNK
jgi:rRNA processing protein Gar1